MSSPGDRPNDWIDQVIHAPARLQIVVQLVVVESMDATFLLNRTGLTWGNLSSHLTKLEEAGYVDIEKSYKGKRPLTMIRLTDEGREAFREYRSRMQETLSQLPDA